MLNFSPASRIIPCSLTYSLSSRHRLIFCDSAFGTLPYRPSRIQTRSVKQTRRRVAPIYPRAIQQKDRVADNSA
jgi:hypothetical protein